MPKPLQRACLEQGLRLDLNWLMRNGFVRSDQPVQELKFRWRLDPTDDEPVHGSIISEMDGSEGYVRIQIGDIDQCFKLAAYHRHFGGHQWYFICPVSQRRCAVLWRPHGASRFASAPAWKRQAGYASQFQTQCDRAISAARKIRMRLGGPEWIALDGRDPAKPKGMRWSTYRRLIQEKSSPDGSCL